MDPLLRRDLLAVRPNPAPRRDLLVRLAEPAGLRQPALDRPGVMLWYIADRLILDAASFQRYVEGLGRWIWPGPEDMALAVLDDIANEVIPNWVRVVVAPAPGRDGGLAGRPQAVVEDRQPLWRGQPPPLALAAWT